MNPAYRQSAMLLSPLALAACDSATEPVTDADTITNVFLNCQ
jgi:hypothetical protein